MKKKAQYQNRETVADWQKYVARANKSLQAERSAIDRAEAAAWDSPKTVATALGGNAVLEYQDNSRGVVDFTELPSTSELLARIQGREAAVKAAGEVATATTIPVEYVPHKQHVPVHTVSA